MKRKIDTPNLIQDANDLNEEILEAAEQIDGELLAPGSLIEDRGDHRLE